jgi:hypothetical protein
MSCCGTHHLVSPASTSSTVDARKPTWPCRWLSLREHAHCRRSDPVYEDIAFEAGDMSTATAVFNVLNPAVPTEFNLFAVSTQR